MDVHNRLIAAGPDLTQQVVVRAPTGNVDLAPTFLHLLGVDIPASMQGRVLEETLGGGPDPATVSVHRMQFSVKSADGSYALTAFFTAVKSGRGNHRYFDFTRVERR